MKRTSSSRLASGQALTNSLRFPFVIHSDTVVNPFSAVVMPNNGRTFGCSRAFHIATPSWNLCRYDQFVGKHDALSSAYFFSPFHITPWGHQNPGCDHPSVPSTLPYGHKLALVLHFLRLVITKRIWERSWEHASVAANP